MVSVSRGKKAGVVGKGEDLDHLLLPPCGGARAAPSMTLVARNRRASPSFTSFLALLIFSRPPSSTPPLPTLPHLSGACGVLSLDCAACCFIAECTCTWPSVWLGAPRPNFLCVRCWQSITLGLHLAASSSNKCLYMLGVRHVREHTLNFFFVTQQHKYNEDIVLRCFLFVCKGNKTRIGGPGSSKLTDDDNKVLCCALTFSGTGVEVNEMGCMMIRISFPCIKLLIIFRVNGPYGQFYVR